MWVALLVAARIKGSLNQNQNQALCFLPACLCSCWQVHQLCCFHYHCMPSLSLFWLSMWTEAQRLSWCLPGLQCWIKTPEVPSFSQYSASWTEQLPGSWPLQCEDGHVGLANPYDVSQSNKCHFNTYPFYWFCSSRDPWPIQYSSMSLNLQWKALFSEALSTFLLLI